MARMKIGIGRVLFVLISLLIAVVAYAPALHINLGLGGGSSVITTSQIHIYGGPIISQWDISSLNVQVQNQPSSQTLGLWYATGQVCAVYRLYDTNKLELQSGTVCNPAAMDYGGLGSTWDSSWTFGHLSSGQYTVGVTYYEDAKAKTNELTKGVLVP